MAYRRLARDDLEEVEQPEENQTETGARAEVAGGLTEGSDLAGLRQLLEQTLKNQEKDSFKQEQRWRSVQLQLNQFREDFEEGKRSERWSLPVSPPSSPPRPQHAPAPAPAAAAAAAAAAPAAAAAAAAAAPAAAAATPMAWTKRAIPRLEAGDNIEQYLTTFERLGTAYRWPREDWAVFLVPYLTGKARSAYVAMDINHAMEYDRVKEAILLKYEINEEVYRRRFREPDVRPGETPRELYTRLKDVFQKWIRPVGKSVEDISEVLIMEQFFRTLTPDIRVWVKEHQPQTGKRAAELVENFVSARQGHQNFRLQPSPRPVARGRSEWFSQRDGPGTREQTRMPARGSFTPARPRTAAYERAEGPIVCYSCGKEGHISPECPAMRPNNASHSCIPRPEREASDIMGRLQTTPATINGKAVMALLDTGSTQTLVQPNLVEKSDFVQDGKLRVECVNGDEHEYPTAEVYLEVGGQTFQMTVGVVERLSHPVVIGQDILVLPELLKTSSPVNMVMTRSKVKVQPQEPEKTVEPATASTLPEWPFAEIEVTPPSKVRVMKTRRQRRQDRLVGTVERAVELPFTQPEEDWEPLPSDVKQQQRDDPTLQKAYDRVTCRVTCRWCRHRSATYIGWRRISAKRGITVPSTR